MGKAIRIMGICLLLAPGLLLIEGIRAEEGESEEGRQVHIVEIQTRTEDDANNEFVTLYNASSEPVDITDWQFEYATFGSDPEDEESWDNKIYSDDRDKQASIDPDEIVILGSKIFQENNDIDVALRIASRTRQGGAHLRLQNEDYETIDYVAWGDVETPLNNTVAPVASGDETIARCFDDGALQVSTDLVADFTIQPEPLLKERLECSGSDNGDEDSDDGNGEPPDDGDNGDDNNGDTDEKICTDIIISEILPNGDQYEPFIELLNKSDDTESLANCQIEVRSEGGVERGPYSLDDVELEPDEYYVLSIDHLATQSLFSTVKTTIYLLDQDNEIHSTTYPSSMPDDVAWAWYGNNTWEKTSNPTPGEANSDEPKEKEYPINPACELVMITELLPNPQGPRSQYPRNEHAFIELYNPTQDHLVLDGCGIQAESSSRSSNIFWLDGYKLSPSEHKALYEIGTDIALPVNPSGSVAILDAGLIQHHQTTYPESMPKGAAWARFGDDEWETTYTPTPGEANQQQPTRPCPEGRYRHPETNRCRNIDSGNDLVPCEDHQYRHPETNRCRNLQTTQQDLVPCEDHQYRHPETNRCRNIETAERELVPCEEHQYRHPETNRCRNIDQGDDLVPCEPHQERNPETNRCRNIDSGNDLVPCEDHQYRHPETNRCRNKVLSNEDAIDEVEDVVVASSGIPPGWWLLGATLIFAAGYALWEWRFELQQCFHRIGKSPPIRAP